MITKPTKYTDTWILKELKDWLKRVKDDEKIVFIKQLCNDKRYSYDDMDQAIRYNKGNSPIYSQISSAYKNVKDIIEQRVYIGALKGDFQANIAQLGLKYNHKWKDKIDQTIEHKGKVELGEVFNGNEDKG